LGSIEKLEKLLELETLIDEAIENAELIRIE
jgi:uncharacterized spore protein YtfJ